MNGAMSPERTLGAEGQAPPPVFVYTQGKSASTTVEFALHAAGLTCHKIHSLERNWLLATTREAVAPAQVLHRWATSS